jgi:valyl-tRNA synthetase
LKKNLEKENLNKNDLGREKFIEKVWEWKNQYGDIILINLKNLVVHVIGLEMHLQWMKIYQNL